MNRKLPQKLAIPAALRRCFVGAAALVPGLALANPTGGQVVAGQATISNPAANGTLVNQSSQSAIVNWQQFNVAGNEYVQFAQPSSSAVILNRVIGGAPSEIFGSIRANGRVFLVNTQGVLFAPGAQVDVGALVASTLDIKNEDFLAGRYVFSGGSAGAGVTNEGTIHAADGGFVVLQGDYAHNTGIVQAKLGQVVLAGGSATTLTLGNNGLVSFAVDEAAVSAQAGASNAGDIIADGGKVIMTAKVARNLVATAVNNTGHVSAQSIVEHNGEIELTADGGDVVDSGTLDVSNTAGSGGTIDITSDANIDLQSGARILASGSTHGGNVRVVADGDLRVRAGSSIVATGGSIGGNAELSGHGSMKLRGAVNLGRGGTLTLDPTNLVIANGSGSGSSATVYETTIEGQLQNGTSVNLVATNSITLNALTDGVLDGQDLQIPGGGGNLFMGIGTMNPASGIFTQGTGGTITFQNKANTINLDGTLTVRGGTTSGTIDIGNVTAKGIDVSVANGPGATGGTLTLGNLTIGSGSFSVLEGDIAGHTTTIGNISYSGGPILFNRQNLNLVTGSIGAAAITVHMVNGNITTGNLGTNQGTVSVISDKGSVTVGNVSASDIIPSGNADAHVTLSAATGLQVGGVLTSAQVTDGTGDADGGATLSTASGNLTVAGAISTYAHAGGSSHVAHADIAITASAGNVTTGVLDAHNAAINITGNNINIGQVSGTSDGGSGSLTQINFHTSGTLTLADTSLSAGGITIATGQGNFNIGSIAATNGGINLDIAGGNIVTGLLSANNGGVSLTAADNVTATNISANNGNVRITSGGAIQVGNVSASGSQVAANVDASVHISATTGITVGGISTFVSASGQGLTADGSVTLSTKGGPINITGIISTDAATFGGNGAPANSKATVSITNDGGGITTSNIFTRASGSGAIANDIAIQATGDVNTGNLAAASAGISVSGHNISLGSLAGSPVSSGASVRGPSLVKAAGPFASSGGGLTNVVLDASGTLSYFNTSLTAGTISLRNGSGNLNAGPG